PAPRGRSPRGADGPRRRQPPSPCRARPQRDAGAARGLGPRRGGGPRRARRPPPRLRPPPPGPAPPPAPPPPPRRASPRAPPAPAHAGADAEGIEILSRTETPPLAGRVLALALLADDRLAVLGDDAIALYRLEAASAALESRRPLPGPLDPVRTPGGLLVPSA